MRETKEFWSTSLCINNLYTKSMVDVLQKHGVTFFGRITHNRCIQVTVCYNLKARHKSNTIYNFMACSVKGRVTECEAQAIKS